MWLTKLDAKQASQAGVAAAIEQLLDRVSVPLDVWKRVTSGAHVRIFVSLFLDDFNRGFVLPAALLQRLAGLGLELDVDIYSVEERDG